MFDFAAQGIGPSPGISSGNGVLVYYDVSHTMSTLVTYDSLQTTGFEVEGGVKVSCKVSGLNYYGNLLPCPRGIVMRMGDGEAGTPHEVGLVVIPADTDPTRFALAQAYENLGKVVGALLTNVVQGDEEIPDGWAVVGFDGFMVLRQQPESATISPGDILYVSTTEGHVTKTAPGAWNYEVGRALPIGPLTVPTGDAIAACWWGA